MSLELFSSKFQVRNKIFTDFFKIWTLIEFEMRSFRSEKIRTKHKKCSKNMNF